MKVWILGSGSAGNAALVECDGSRLVVDAGFGVRTLAARLRMIGVDPRSVESCILTHEHTDHIRGALSAARRWGWRLHATAGTTSATKLRACPVDTFEPGRTLSFTRMTVESTPTPHDARQSVGFVVTSRATGARAAFFYDLGHAPERVASACRDVDILVLESNHDDEMLRTGPYPPWLQARIASDVGHLSNRCAGQLVREVASGKLRHLVLAHLSEKNNQPALALQSMRVAARRTSFRGTTTAAKQDDIVGPFIAGPQRPVQYELGM